jgi:apolipoprotein N-acyltransferase
VNAALASWWCERQRGALRALGAAAALVAVALAYGTWQLRVYDGREPHEAVPIATAQANLDLGTQWHAEFYGANLGAYADLTTQAVAARAARLVIWPESALTFFLESEPSYRRYLAQLLTRSRTTLLTGGPRLVGGAGGETYRNAAFVVTPTGEIAAVYEKRMLVPFAEYFPLAGVTLLRRQFGKVREFTPGTRQEPLATPAGPAGVMICNEAMLGGEAVDRVRRGAQWLVTLTNDSWVGRRHYAEIALAMVRLRAVEVRRWLVRASTSGPSALIDPAGRLVDRLPFGDAGFLRAGIERRDGWTGYARVGDSFAWGCVLVTLVAIAKRRRT